MFTWPLRVSVLNSVRFKNLLCLLLFCSVSGLDSYFEFSLFASILGRSNLRGLWSTMVGLGFLLLLLLGLLCFVFRALEIEMLSFFLFLLRLRDVDYLSLWLNRTLSVVLIASTNPYSVESRLSSVNFLTSTEEFVTSTKLALTRALTDALVGLHRRKASAISRKQIEKPGCPFRSSSYLSLL